MEHEVWRLSAEEVGPEAGHHRLGDVAPVELLKAVLVDRLPKLDELLEVPVRELEAFVAEAPGVEVEVGDDFEAASWVRNFDSAAAGGVVDRRMGKKSSFDEETAL